MSEKKQRSAAQLAALASARGKRRTAKERKPPEGYRSVEHFLDELHEYCHRHMELGGERQYSPVRELAHYLRVNESSVRKWLKRDKIPMQPTIDAIHRWLMSKQAGL